MRLRGSGEVPELTVRMARAAFPKGTLAIRVRDELGALFDDERFAVAFGTRGRPGRSPGRLAMVTVLQFVENLTDRQAADAVRGRIDWKYCLGLELEDPGFEFTVLSQYRTRLLAHGLDELALDVLLARLGELGLVTAGGQQRTDATHVLSAVRDLNRLELAGESVRAALEVLAAAAPDWLGGVIDAGEWTGRYGRRVDSWRLPTSEARRDELAGVYGADAAALCAAVAAPGAPGWLRELPAVAVLRTVLIQNYLVEVTDGREVIRRREAKDGLPPGRARISSPYDLDARWAAKGEDLFWNGYKVHISETCDSGPDPGPGSGAGSGPGAPPQPRPNVITNVATTHAAVPDSAMTTPIHQALAARDLSPAEHYLDSGYPSVAGVSTAQRDFGIEVVSPLLADQSRQARAGAGFDRASFTIDFDTQQARCPQGQSSTWWNTVTQRGTDAIVIKFAAQTCQPCPVREACTRSVSPRAGRQLTVPPRELHDAQLTARNAQRSTDWQARYAIRAGAESTMHQAVAATRHARYRRARGRARTAPSSRRTTAPTRRTQPAERGPTVDTKRSEAGPEAVGVLAAGDHFVAPSLFDDALRAELGSSDDLEVTHLTSRWPTEPFGPVGSGDSVVEEASGTEDDLIAALEGARICLTQMAPFTARVFEARPELEMLAVSRGGPVNVDLAAADRAGVVVAQAPGRNAPATAEFTVGMMLAALRHIPLGDAELRAGRWRGDLYAYDEAGLELQGATVGLVGYGAIGRIVARVLHAFGATVLVADPYTDTETAQADGVRLVDLDELLRSSSVVSLHARLSDETDGIIGAEEIAKLPRGAVLVNTARGGLLDYAALPGALHSGQLRGLAVDVYDVEPPPADWPLHDAPYVVATPHLAGATRQTAYRAARIAAGEAGRFLRGEALAHPANDTARQYRSSGDER